MAFPPGDKGQSIHATRPAHKDGYPQWTTPGYLPDNNNTRISCLITSESHKSLHHPYSRHEVYGTAYPAFPRYGQDRRDIVEEPLPHAAAYPGSDLRRVRGG